jgi:apolipoprotein D and lipocalin family protein
MRNKIRRWILQNRNRQIRIINVFILFTLFMFGCNSTGNTMKIDKTTVRKLELDKYLGTWYEIARFQHPFEKDLVGVTATYSLRDDGKIKVLNQGYYKSLDGDLKTAIGKAKRTNEPGKFKVAFFLFFYADYNVLELDDNYQWAMIGSSSPNYFWILSRTPHISDELYNELVAKAQKRGYDVGKIFKVPQR